MNISKGIGILLVVFCAISILANSDGYVPAAEKMPFPTGGMKSIYSNIEYPEHAKKNGVQGRVFAMIYVDESGNVNDVKIIKGIGFGCDEAAIEGIKKTKFNPGEHKGSKLKVKFAMPITFKLN